MLTTFHAQRRPGPKPRRQAAVSAAPNRPGLVAQRRPGPKPRRQLAGTGRTGPGNGGRSTKAGAETPATALDGCLVAFDSGRSTKAGAETPATDAGRSHRAYTPTRSTKAGAETPATARRLRRCQVRADDAQRRPGPKPRRQPRSRRRRRRSPRPLNEGRGRNPGDRRQAVPVLVRGLPGRSTKAGAETPATVLPGSMAVAVLARSTKAGAETPATVLTAAEIGS